MIKNTKHKSIQYTDGIHLGIPLRLRIPQEVISWLAVLIFLSRKVALLWKYYSVQCSPQVLSAYYYSGPHAFHMQPYFFDVVIKMIDVVTNSAQTTPTR